MKYLLELCPYDCYAMTIWFCGQPESKNITLHLIGQGNERTFEPDEISISLIEEVMSDDAYAGEIYLVAETPLRGGKSVRYAGCTWDRDGDTIAWFGLKAKTTRSVMENAPGTYVDWRKAFPKSPVVRKQM